MALSGLDYEKISIHAPRVGSDQAQSDWEQNDAISIHAPRVGSDSYIARGYVSVEISIHAPRVGSDPTDRTPANRNCISIHAPRVGSDQARLQEQRETAISIHAPRVGSDRQSRLWRWWDRISIHAPRVGSDSKDAQISGSIFGKGVKSVGHNPGKAVPNRFKSRYPLHRFPRKSCEPPGILCTLTLRATKSGYPPADRCSCSRNARLSFRIGSPDSRNGGCPFPDP